MRSVQVGELLLHGLRLLLFRLQFGARTFQLRPRVLQRNRQRFFLPDDLGKLRAQCVGNFPRFRGEVFQPGVRFGGSRFRRCLLTSFVDVAFEVRRRGLAESLRSRVERGPRASTVSATSLTRSEDPRQQRRRLFGRKGMNSIEKGRSNSAR